MNMLLIHEDLTLDVSRWQREASEVPFRLNENMAKAPYDEDFLAILDKTAEQVTASRFIGWNHTGTDLFVVGEERLPAGAFQGWLEPVRVKSPRGPRVLGVGETIPLTERQEAAEYHADEERRWGDRGSTEITREWR